MAIAEAPPLGYATSPPDIDALSRELHPSNTTADLLRDSLIGNLLVNPPEVHIFLGQEVEAIDGIGKVYSDLACMSDGTQNRMLRFQAKQPLTDIPVIMDTAQGTQPGTYINYDLAAAIMALGFDVVIKGPDIGDSISQTQSAMNTHLILSALAEIGVLNDSRIAVEGYSRGAMIGLGTIALAKYFGRQVLYANLTDPCMTVGLGPNVQTAIKALHLPSDLGGFLLGCFKHGITKHPQALHEALDISPEGALQFVNTFMSLLSGEPAKFAKMLPIDIGATVALYKGCHWNDTRTLTRILREIDALTGLRKYENIEIIRPHGNHAKALDDRTSENGPIVVRFRRLIEQVLEKQEKPQAKIVAIDYYYVNHGLRSAA